MVIVTRNAINRCPFDKFKPPWDQFRSCLCIKQYLIDDKWQTMNDEWHLLFFVSSTHHTLRAIQSLNIQPSEQNILYPINMDVSKYDVLQNIMVYCLLRHPDKMIQAYGCVDMELHKYIDTHQDQKNIQLYIWSACINAEYPLMFNVWPVLCQKELRLCSLHVLGLESRMTIGPLSKLQNISG